MADVKVTSVVLKRLIEEVRQEKENPAKAYDRVYNRHRRS